VNTTGWARGLQVTAGGTGVVSHAGVALLRGLADNAGLTGGLSRALATDRLLTHDRGRVLADLACAIADGGEAISDFRVIGDQRELFGPAASVPTVWRALSEIAAGGTKTAGRVTAAVHAARRRAWAGIAARHGGLPGVRLADRVQVAGRHHRRQRRLGPAAAFQQPVREVAARPQQVRRRGLQLVVQKAGRVDTARCGHRRVSFGSTVRGLPKNHAVAALHAYATPINGPVSTPPWRTQLSATRLAVGSTLSGQHDLVVAV
jgi:hypothetical protein